MTIWWQRRRRDSVTSNGTIIDRRPIWVNGLHWLALVDKIICREKKVSSCVNLFHRPSGMTSFGSGPILSRNYLIIWTAKDPNRIASDRIEIHAFISYREMAISHTRLTTNNLSSCTPILLK